MMSEQKKASELVHGLKELQQKAASLKAEVQGLGREKGELEKRLRSLTELTSSSFAVSNTACAFWRIYPDGVDPSASWL